MVLQQLRMKQFRNLNKKAKLLSISRHVQVGHLIMKKWLKTTR